MTVEVSQFNAALLGWYDAHCRAFLESTAQDRVEALDDLLTRLRGHETRKESELPVCFLGNAGVGKSTLLNALVAGQISVLPQGGVGPLTAQATVVRYAEDSFFRATYQSAGRLNNLLFALERHHESELRKLGHEVVEASNSSTLSEEDALELETSLPQHERDGDRLQSYADQAKQLLRGDQYAKLEHPYLADGLRACLGQELRWNSELEVEDRERVADIRALISRGKTGDVSTTRSAGTDLPAFLEDLKRHASGYLAPLIRTLEVGWDAEFLRGGLVLVDLPGVGVANDEHRAVTQQWIRHSKAVALVVDRAGVTEASADLLRTTGFLNSLLHYADGEDSDAPVLIVVGVKLDTSATDARNDEKQRNPGQKARPWIVHFDEVCAKFRELIRGQVHQQLHQCVDAGAEDTRADRLAAIERVLATLEIHPVSAFDLRRYLEADEDEPPRIKNADESRVPALRSTFHQVVERREARVAARGASLGREAYERTNAAIQVVMAQWEQEDRAVGEAEKLNADLSTFIEPLQQEFHNRQGAFRNYLRQTVPEQIDARLDVAAASAKDAIQKYLRGLKNYHWSTLRAAVRRGGHYDGARTVDLPNELTLRFEEPVALVWSKYILSSLRKNTRDMGDAYVDLVGSVVGWTKEQGARVQPKLVEALHHDLKAQTKNLGSVGKEAIDELKETVKAELVQQIETRVRKKCQQFVQSKRDAGPGVADRMHEFFREELAEAIVEVAKPIAKKVLLARYNEVQSEIQGALKQHQNPLDTARNAIVGAYEIYVRRSDSQKRQAILAHGQRVIAERSEIVPEPLTSAVAAVADR